MDAPRRKPSRLPEHDYSAPGAYFVTICTQNRRQILSTVTVGTDALGGPTVQLTDIGKIAEKYLLSTDRIGGLHVEKYVIMPNHVHMILVIEGRNGPPGASAPTAASIPDAVGAWKRLVHREVGQKIFQRSYHDHVIRNEEDFRAVWEYIENNPARWAKDRYYTEG